MTSGRASQLLSRVGRVSHASMSTLARAGCRPCVSSWPENPATMRDSLSYRALTGGTVSTSPSRRGHASTRVMGRRLRSFGGGRRQVVTDHVRRGIHKRSTWSSTWPPLGNFLWPPTVGIAVAHLVARDRSAVVDLTPTPAKEWAIRKFGSNDIPVLIGSVFAVG